MAMLDDDCVTVRLEPSDLAALDRLRGPVPRASFMRLLLRRVERQRDGRPLPPVDALAGYAEGDRTITSLVRRIQSRERLEGLRAIAGD
jgi:hypothetical protein